MKRIDFKSVWMLIAAARVLPLQACSQDSADQSASEASDTAVHQAEVAQGQMGDMMARGEAVYLGNCAACHQPTGMGLAGAFPPLARPCGRRSDSSIRR